jgi:probable rRNA maturation factor
MLEVEVVCQADLRATVPAETDIEELCAAAAAAASVHDGHVAIAFVDAPTIASLNARHLGVDAPTDVLSFPIDLAASPPPASADPPPRELGDVVICPAYTADIAEAIVHGVLHLVGFDHESDDGDMLALQAQVLAGWRAGKSA